MKFTSLKSRTLILAAFFSFVMVVFVMRMMQLQVVDGDYYQSLIRRGVQRTQEIKAARGEILDREGRPFAVNRVSFDVVIDRAFLPAGEENEVLLRLVALMEEEGEQWIDNLPITATAPFDFLEGRDNDVARLKRYVDVNEYADAENVMHWLTQTYGLGEYTGEEARVLAGIRYEMSQKDFSISLPYRFAEDVTTLTATKLMERSYEVPGATIQQSAAREYPNGTVAPHIIGLTGPIYAEEYADLADDYKMDDTIGKSGLELVMERELRGSSGQRVVYINEEGEVSEVIETVPPVPGNTVYTTIDQKLQAVAEEALELQINYLQNYAASGQGREAYAGAVVAVDIETGGVLVAATYPSYDLNSYLQDYTELAADRVNNPLFNRALQGTYMPGSIFKPTVALAGLASGTIDRNSTVFCGRVYTRFNDYQPTCLGAHGNFNVVAALRESCNIFFYDVGYRTELETINDYARALGLGVDPSLEIPTPSGSLTTRENIIAQEGVFNPGYILQASIGQKDNRFTPLQLANYSATIANRGTRMQLTLVSEVRTYDQETVLSSLTPTIASQMSDSPSVFDAVIEGMVECARIGSGSYYGGYLGKTFANYEITVAAKTGTPESTEHLNSTFICYAPAENPKIAIAVIIENGWHGYTGVPVARAIFDEYFFGSDEEEMPLEDDLDPETDLPARDFLDDILDSLGSSSEAELPENQ